MVGSVCINKAACQIPTRISQTYLTFHIVCHSLRISAEEVRKAYLVRESDDIIVDLRVFESEDEHGDKVIRLTNKATLMTADSKT